MSALPLNDNNFSNHPAKGAGSHPNPDLGMTLFTQSRDIILVIRLKDGRILEANLAAERTYGYNHQELLQLSITDLRPRQTHPFIGAQMQQANNSGILFETLHKRKDGTVFPVEVSSVGTELGEERVNISIVRDITERKLTEKSLAESEERYRKLVELSPDCIAVHSEGKIAFINPVGVKILGANSAEDLIGKSILDFIPAEDQPIIVERITQVMQGLAAPSLEEKITCLDGRIIEAEISASPISYQGKPAIMLIGRDITEKTKDRQAIQQSEQQLRALILASPLGLHQYELLADGQLIFTGANPMADQILRIDHQSMIGLPIEDAFPLHRQTDIPAIYRQVAQEGIPYSCEQIAYQDERIQGIFEIHAFQTGPSKMAVFFQNITDKKKAEQDLRESEEKFRTLIEQNSEGVVLLDELGTIIEWNRAQERSTGIPRAEALGRPSWDLQFRMMPPEKKNPAVYEKMKENGIRLLQTAQSSMFDHPFEILTFRPDGKRVLIQQTAFPIKTSLGFRIGSIMRDITEAKQAEKALRESEERYRRLFEDAVLGIFQSSPAGKALTVNPAFARMFGYSSPEDALATIKNVSTDVFADPNRRAEIAQMIKEDPAQNTFENIYRRKDDSVFPGTLHLHPVKDTAGQLLYFEGLIEDISERKRTEEKLQQTTNWLEEAERVAQVGGWALEMKSGQVWVSPEAFKIYGLQEKELTIPMIQAIPLPEYRPGLDHALKGLIEGTSSYDIEFRIKREDDGAIRDIRSMAEYNPKTKRVFGAFQDITEQKRAENKIQTQLKQLSALRTIDQSILSRLDLEQTLELLLEKITGLLQVDAANFLLYQPNSQTLITAAERGLPISPVWDASLALKDTHAGRAALNLQMDFISDLGQIEDSLTQKLHQRGENFASYVAVPLVAKGELKGVLQIFTRSRLQPSPEWMGFLDALADQAAIAINSALLFNEQQQTHARLTRAYEDTIDGWSHALDLRDKETEGHSQRVTDLTLELARRMDIPDDQLVHIRRGAKLHDIGKMGIPDSILLKPDRLTEAEWEIMRRHPTFATNLLYPIEFLSPALDIPFSHHERWDGTGYPQRLKGEEIPLAARIFAIIDVWDALTHDRPYRPAWTIPDAMEYIRDQSGKHFDPKVVEQFLALNEDHLLL
jgi:PAS domain S-box-containing protein